MDSFYDTPFLLMAGSALLLAHSWVIGMEWNH